MTSGDLRLTCAVFPPPQPDNPYQVRFHEELVKRNVVILTPPKLTPMWAMRNRVAAVHLHWIEYLLRSRRGKRLQWAYSVARVAQLILALVVLRIRGVRVVWTVHNVTPHEERFPRLERIAFRIVARLATTLLVHSESAADRVAHQYGSDEKRIRIAPHGNYLGSYQHDLRPQSRIRKKLEIDEGAFVYLIFGALRRYKRVPEAVREFRVLHQSDAVLLVAGSVPDNELKKLIESAAADDPRVRLRFGFVPSDDVGTLFAAADAAVFNYEEVFSSGSILLALSFGLPIVAPRAGSAAEVAGPCAAELFEEGHLLEALQRVRDGDREARVQAAHDASLRARWEPLADEAVAAYSGHVPSPAE